MGRISTPRQGSVPLLAPRKPGVTHTRCLRIGADVVSGDISAAVDHTGHGLDAEVGVSHRPVAPELRRGALDVETVISVPLGNVAPQEAVVVLLPDCESIVVASSDPVSADNVVAAADRRVWIPR
jgi:hypothetical protein